MPSAATKVLNPSIINDNAECVPLVPCVNLRNTYLAACSALLYIIVMGMVSSYSAPATVDMQKPGGRFMDITADEITWIASLNLISTVIGNCLSAYVSQKLGRKAVLMYVSAFYVFGWLLIAYAPSIPFIYAGRLISGFCVGLCCVAVPAYVVEISTVEIRGLLASGFQLAFVFGVFFVMSLGIVLRWSWLAVSGAVLASVAACLMLSMPESPPWLVRECKNEEAVKSLRFLKGKNVDVQKEVQEIMKNSAGEPKNNIAFKDFLEPGLYKPTVFAILLFFFQQSSGISFVMSYTVEIFQKNGSSLNPAIAAATVAGIQVIFTAVSCILMDKVGRRLLYITSGSFIVLSLTALGVYSLTTEKYEMNLNYFGWVPLVCFVVYIAAFSIGFGPIPNVMTPEMVPIRSRSTVLAIANLFCSVFAFIVTKTYDDIRTSCGDYGLYFIYSFFSLLGTIFCWLFLPETKGRTIHEINRSFSVSRD